MKFCISFCLLFLSLFCFSQEITFTSAVVCFDDGTDQTTLTRVDINRQGIGVPYPELKYYLDGTGAQIDVSGGTVTVGACGGAAASTDYEVTGACDYDNTNGTGTPFLRLISIDPSGTVTVANLDLTGAPYTPTGDVANEFCAGYNDGEGLTFVSGTTVSLTDDFYLEWTIENVSLDAGATMTTNGATVPIYTYDTKTCLFRINPVTLTANYCLPVSAAGGQFETSYRTTQ